MSNGGASAIAAEAADGDRRRSARDEPILPRTSHAVIMTGDLMLEGDLPPFVDDTTGCDGAGGRRGRDVLASLVRAHRAWNAGELPHKNRPIKCNLSKFIYGTTFKYDKPIGAAPPNLVNKRCLRS